MKGIYSDPHVQAPATTAPSTISMTSAQHTEAHQASIIFIIITLGWKSSCSLMCTCSLHALRNSDGGEAVPLIWSTREDKMGSISPPACDRVFIINLELDNYHCFGSSKTPTVVALSNRRDIPKLLPHLSMVAG